jgi:hypothetical protein
MPKGAAMSEKYTRSLEYIDWWFDKIVIPARTTWAGWSYNRVLGGVGPRAMIYRHAFDDPNGVCEDAALYVFRAYQKKFADLTTDGYHIAAILWNGHVLSHKSIVMLPTDKLRKQSYKMVGDHLQRLALPYEKEIKTPGCDRRELFALHVYDLYKKQRATVDTWWRNLDDEYGGTIKLGKYADI